MVDRVARTEPPTPADAPWLEARFRALAAELPIPAEDREPVLAQARWIEKAIAALDELPLEGVEPAAAYRLTP